MPVPVKFYCCTLSSSSTYVLAVVVLIQTQHISCLFSRLLRPLAQCQHPQPTNSYWFVMCSSHTHTHFSTNWFSYTEHTHIYIFTFPSLEVNGVGDNIFQLHEFQFGGFFVLSRSSNWPDVSFNSAPPRDDLCRKVQLYLPTDCVWKERKSNWSPCRQNPQNNAKITDNRRLKSLP